MAEVQAESAAQLAGNRCQTTRGDGGRSGDAGGERECRGKEGSRGTAIRGDSTLA